MNWFLWRCLLRSELVITTYEKPEYLALTLGTLMWQAHKPDSVCIADDGSDDRTADVITKFHDLQSDIDVRHEWHPNTGFQKNMILNQAVRNSTADYMIFIDDDCLMHETYVARHLKLANPDRFLTGSLIRMRGGYSKSVLAQGQATWDERGRPYGWTPQKLSEYLKSMPFPHSVMALMDRLSPVRCSWAGCNSSTFKSNILKVNGFDTNLGYGGEDKEFGARLINSGIVGYNLRYTAPLYHIDHGRGYVDPYIIKQNRAVIEHTRATGKTLTDSGIDITNP